MFIYYTLCTSTYMGVHNKHVLVNDIYLYIHVIVVHMFNKIFYLITGSIKVKFNTLKLIFN